MSIELNGTNQYLELDVNMPSLPLTVVAWFKADVTGDQTIAYIGDKNHGYRWLSLRLRAAGYVEGWHRYSSDDGRVGSSEYDTDVWQVVIMEFASGSLRRIWLDNEASLESDADSLSTPNLNRISFGRLGDQSPAHYLNGLLSEIAIYEDLLTQAERSDIFGGTAPGDVATSKLWDYWSLDDDLEGVNGHDLVAFGSPGFSSDNPLGGGEPPPGGDMITVLEPVQYQVMQRCGNVGDIPISGTTDLDDDEEIEASFSGGPYKVIGTVASGAFSGVLSGQLAGQGTLTVRAKDDTQVNDAVSDVGIGDIILCLGQSNMSGRGTNNQSYSHPSLKATLFGNDDAWKELADPYDESTDQVDPVSEDGVAGGSFIPLLATLYMEKYNIPVAFVPCPKGGTSVSDWQKGGGLYTSAKRRFDAIGGRCAASLWWQGERDVVISTSRAAYQSALEQLANDLADDFNNAPFYVALIGPYDGQSAGNLNAIREAQNGAVEENVNVKRGPVLIDLDFVDAVHAATNAELLEVAERWMEAIS